jgi:hypothetical protein
MVVPRSHVRMAARHSCTLENRKTYLLQNQLSRDGWSDSVSRLLNFRHMPLILVLVASAYFGLEYQPC